LEDCAAKHKVDLQEAKSLHEEEQTKSQLHVLETERKLTEARDAQGKAESKLDITEKNAERRVSQAEEQTSQIRARVVALETELALVSAATRPKVFVDAQDIL